MKTLAGILMLALLAGCLGTTGVPLSPEEQAARKAAIIAIATSRAERFIDLSVPTLADLSKKELRALDAACPLAMISAISAGLDEELFDKLLTACDRIAGVYLAS